MFYRFQYEVRYQFNDAISAKPIYARRARLKPASFVGFATGEFRMKAANFEEAAFMANEELAVTTWGIRSIRGKLGEAKARITGSEVLIDGNWYDTRLVSQDVLNGAARGNVECLYISVGNTEENHGRLRVAA